MSRAHLLHIFPSFETGGVQRRFVTLANRLHAAYRHTVIAMDGNLEAAKGLEAGVEIRFMGPPPNKRSVLCAIRVKEMVERLKPALTLTYNWGAMDGVLGASLAAVCPVIHTEDGFGRDEATTLKRRRVMARRLLLNRIFQTVVPSHTLHRIALERYRVTRRKLRLILNGVDTDRFRPGLSRQMRAALSIPPEATLFGYVGHLRAEKNLTLLLRAFAQAAIPGARLLLLGSGPCEEELRRVAGELNLADSVVFHPSTPDPVPFYAALDIFVLSSDTEQMPISLLEAMACGLHTVCTDVGDMRVMLDAQEGALARSGDTAGYAQALRAAAMDRARRAAAGQKNRERCVTRYSLANMIHGYQSLYEEAIRNWTA